MRFARHLSLRHIIIISLLLAALTGFLLARRSRLDRTRIYVVGYESVPPFQIVAPGQPPSGLSVDLVREAARRKSIQLRWVRMGTGSEDAVRSGKVDLWPIMTVLERRKKFIHFTDPYLESSDVVLVRANSPLPALNGLDRATFALLDLAIHFEGIRRLWPKARLLPKPSQKDALNALCNGEADALFLNERSGLNLLLQEGGCPNVGLRIQSLPGRTNVYAIGSTFESAPAADAIRGAISEMSASGELAGIFNRYGYFSQVDLASIEELTRARRSRTQLLSILAAMSVVLLLVMIVSRRLHVARVAAERANSAKTLFLANISHEIRTPISGVLGLSRELSDASLPGDAHNLAVTLHQSAQSLLTVIDDMLDLSKVEAGHLMVSAEPFDLPEAITALAIPFRLEAEARGLTLNVTIDQGVPQFVSGDRGRIRQVLSNLVSNALKFTDAGGVSIRVSRGDSPPLVRFSVSDTGIGIPQDLQARMFQPFMQADPSYSRKRGGSGLGLTIAARLIEAMKGSIHLESAPGKGSTFHVLLPLPPATMTAAPPATAPDRLEPLRVLVAEDNPVNQLVAVRMLQRMGHVVDVAADGQQAIDAFHAGAYDLVLMDCQMPGIDGFEATRRIRKLENTGRTPVIAITAHAMEGAREQCLQAGMDDYLAKPLTLEKLSALLQVWCRGVRATRVR